MYNTLLTDLQDHIFTITINRPGKLNALNQEVLKELGAAMDEVHKNRDIKSVIITGAGEKAFVAGADISEFVGLNVVEGMYLSENGQRLCKKIEDSPKPVVAAINGFALGGGCELAMACHFRIAAENARFGQPEVNLGIIPGFGGSQRLVQLVGKGRAIEMMISGNMIDAGVALQYGLVNYVVPLNELIAKTRSVLDTVNSRAPLAVAKCIEAANAVFNFSADGFRVEVQGFGECFGSEDMKEGTAAFLEKRKPEFKGR